MEGVCHGGCGMNGEQGSLPVTLLRHDARIDRVVRLQLLQVFERLVVLRDVLREVGVVVVVLLIGQGRERWWRGDDRFHGNLTQSRKENGVWSLVVVLVVGYRRGTVRSLDVVVQRAAKNILE